MVTRNRFVNIEVSSIGDIFLVSIKVETIVLKKSIGECIINTFLAKKIDTF